MRINLAARLTGVEASVEAMQDALDEQVSRALGDIDTMLAEDAAATHTFQNRTGRLEGAIAERATRGTFRSDTLSGGTTANTKYASYLEEGKRSETPGDATLSDGQTLALGVWSFLGQALVHRDHDVTARLDEGLRDAIHEAGAGWREE